ncbi:MAG: hypothetical protein IKA36_04145 [Clostridia bacterium]|nr:hypothetical protein [Clostridia bacterium]
MDDKEIKIERWSVCERYKNYKSNNYYKEPLQFRPHPANVVRDVIMYHIYRNEGMMCNDDLIQYIKNKIIDDLNAIFMLYEYAPDAIKTIKRLMSSKHHHGTEDSYHEMMFHALTIKDARDILIEQISNVLIKCIPEPLGNINFDVIMKDDVKEETTMSDRETNTADKPFDFAVKSVSAKLYNRIFKIVYDLINESCDHVEDMTIDSKTFEVNPEIGYDEYKVLMLTGTIGYHLSVTLDIDMNRAHEEAYEAIVNKFKFKHCLDPKGNQAFIRHMTDFVCRNLSYDKSMELEKESNTPSTTSDKIEQEKTKTPKMKLRYLFRAWSDKYQPQPFIVKSVDKDEKYFEQTENIDGTSSITRSHCIEVYIFNHLHKIFLTSLVWNKPTDYDDEMVTSFLEFVRVRGIPVQLTLTRSPAGYVNLHIETEDGNLWVDENCDDVMIESRNSTTLDTLCSGIEDEIRFTITDSTTLNTIECVTYMYTDIFEEQKKRPVISINIADGIVTMSNFWISRVLEQVSQYNECAYRFDRYESIISCNTEEGTKKYKFKEFIDEVVEPIVCKYLKLRYIRECNTNQTNSLKENE